MNRSFPKAKKQYIRPVGYDNLYVIPYIRGRLVFAELVARAIEEDGFDQVVIDLPMFMNKGDLWKKAVEIFPRVSSLIIKKEDNSYSSFLFVPNDAACIALDAVQMHREWGRNIELTCIDDSLIIHYPGESLHQSEIRIQDDYFVHTDGLKEYFRNLDPLLADAWTGLSKDQRFILECRGELISDRLRSVLKNNKKTLFVCEYRLWWFVAQTFETSYKRKNRYFSYKWKNLQAALVNEDPLALWAHEAMDDYPKVVEHFYNQTHANRLRSFDKLHAINDLIKDSLSSVQIEKSTRLSVRKILTFQQHLNNMLLSSIRAVPLPLTQLYDSAYACIGSKYAKELIRSVLNYPHKYKNRALGYYDIGHDSINSATGLFNVPARSFRTFLHTGSQQYTLDSFNDDLYSSEKKRRLLYLAYEAINKKLKESLSKDSSFSWEVQRTFDLLDQACMKARDNISKENIKKRVTKSWGSLKDGIDWKSTIGSKAHGEDLFYIKTGRMNSKTLRNVNAFTPVTFLFTDDLKGHGTTTLLDGNAEYLDYASGNLTYLEAKKKNSDYVESVFITYSDLNSFYDNHIHKYNLSSITLLYTQRVIGAQRYNDIVKRPKKFHCRIKPREDDELNKFTLEELGIAWASKYAESSVLVVARDNWKPSILIREFAEKKKVHLNYQSLSRFNPDFIERIKNFYVISRALEKHPARDYIVRRFVE